MCVVGHHTHTTTTTTVNTTNNNRLSQHYPVNIVSDTGMVPTAEALSQDGSSCQHMALARLCHSMIQFNLMIKVFEHEFVLAANPTAG